MTQDSLRLRQISSGAFALGEARAVARLAAPVVVAQVGMLLLGVVDTMMLGRVSKSALAAGALGHSVSFGMLSVAIGLLMALDPLVAQAHGRGARERVAAHLVRGAVMAVALSLPLGALHWIVGPYLRRIGQPAELVPLATDYLRALIPGLPAFLLFLVLRQTLQAMSMVRPAVIAVVAANVFNAVADYGLVFGGFGLPRLEVQGSAIATSASRYVLLGVLAVAARGQIEGSLRPHLAAALSWRGQRDLLRLGLPIGLHYSLEFWVFTTVGLMMGSLGAAQFAGHQIALVLASLSFMVPLGVSGAAATRVGNAVGRLDGEAARRSARVCLVMGGAVMSVSALLFLSAPWALARLFTPDPEVLAMATLLLPVAAAFQVADGTQVVAAGILRGAADTRFAALCAAVGFWGVGLPLGAYLTFGLGAGPAGLWWGLTAGLTAVAMLLVLRTRRRLHRPVEQLLAEREG